MKAAPGKEAELTSALKSVIEPPRSEAGNVNYDLLQSLEDPGVFFFYVNWESAEVLDKHLEAPHLFDFASKLGDLLDENGLTITRLRRIA